MGEHLFPYPLASEGSSLLGWFIEGSSLVCLPYSQLKELGETELSPITRLLRRTLGTAIRSGQAPPRQTLCAQPSQMADASLWIRGTWPRLLG